MKQAFTTLICTFFLFGLSAQTFTVDYDPDRAIPDDSCDATNEFGGDFSALGLANLDATFGVESITINITHTFTGDLDIFLIAPDNTTVELTTDNGGAGEDYTNTVFDCDAASSIVGQSAPFTGTFWPEGDLLDFNNGQDPNGIWILRVCDDFVGDTGTVDSWSITFSNDPCAPPAPGNDLCADAINVTSPSNTSGTTVNSTTTGEPPTCDTTVEAPGVWYTYVSSSPETVALDICGASHDSKIAVYTGTCGSFTCVIGEDDDASNCPGNTDDPAVDFNTTGTPASPVTYYIYVYGFAGATGTFTLNLDSAPLNDACGNAIPLMDGSLSTGSTANAADIESLTSCEDGGGGGQCATGGDGFSIDFTPGVWFSYTSSTAGETITVATDNVGTNFDTEIQVFSGSCGGLTCVGGDDDGGDGTGDAFDSRFCWVSTASFAPVTYYIYIDGHNNATGNYAVSLSTAAPLPVELASFRGEAMPDYNLLRWSTASELNTEMHVIERSEDGRTNWQSIGEVAAAGNTTDMQYYELQDHRPLPNGFYRVKSVDFDGYTGYSDLVLLTRKVTDFAATVAPNPVRTVTQLRLLSPKAGNCTVTTHNAVGQIIQRAVVDLPEGSSMHPVDLSSQQSGIYFITIDNGTTSLTERVVKQ